MSQIRRVASYVDRRIPDRAGAEARAGFFSRISEKRYYQTPTGLGKKLSIFLIERPWQALIEPLSGMPSDPSIKSRMTYPSAERKERQNRNQNEDQNADRRDWTNAASDGPSEQRMRIIMAATIAFTVRFSAAAPGGAADLTQCSDRNALNGISVDARLVAIKYYFAGLVRSSTDRTRQACYEAHALNDAGTAILNKTLELIETNCSTMESAARTAIEPACP